MKFGELLKRSLDQQGISINKFSKTTGISRSMLQYIIKGERKLPVEDFGRTVSSASFTEKQIDELRKAYFTSTFSDEQYKNVQKIIYLIDKYQSSLCGEPCVYETVDLSKPFVIGTQTELLSVLYTMFCANGADCIYTNFPMGFELGTKIIYDSLKAGKIKEYKAVAYLDNGASSNNLYVYFNASFYALLGHIVRAVSATQQIEDLKFFTPTPYYVIGPTGMIMFDYECSNGCYIVDKQLITAYVCNFNDVYENSAPICHTDESAVEMLNDFVGKITQVKENYVLSNALICGSIFDREVYETCVSDVLPNPKPIIANVLNHYELCTKRTSLFLLTLQALKDFVDYGRQPDVPSLYMRPLSIEQRIRTLKNLKQQIKDGVIKVKLIDPMRLKISNLLTISVRNCGNYSYVNLCISQPIENGGDFCTYCTTIENTVAVSDFENLMIYLKNSDLICQDESLMTQIDYFVNMLEHSVK